ncbi:MAG: DsbC family protein [Candidatus Thiodiazotropha sp.]
MKQLIKGGPVRGLIYAMLSAVICVSSAMAETAQHDEEILKIRESVGKILSNGEITSISGSEIDGLYEVMVGTQVLYVSANGKHLLTGKLFDIEKQEDLTTPKINQAKAAYLQKLNEDEMIIFAPEKYQHTITVFTDIDCGYCRKLHAEIKDYNDLGIRVRYLMYPRAGVGSKSFEKAVSVYCADDQNDAFTHAKAGDEIPKKSCDNPVSKQYELGQMLGVRGTPAIFLENGEMLPGYMPAKRMNKVLSELDEKLAGHPSGVTQ